MGSESLLGCPADVKYECREVKRNDFVYLFCMVKEKARAQHEYHVLAQEHNVKSSFAKGQVDCRITKSGTKPEHNKAAAGTGALRVLVDLVVVPIP
ncbi:hypothetical protein F443_00033 [Phytophthora nicotianae P1569]|uniref:Uncharacterized protein n=2 Tax=Phytophthora nicotianae TaxID=4792 RepID=V9G1R6_PHYNI|nr:hypothetical protein F443_00033 [Phytophthora nicotianae P1569]